MARRQTYGERMAEFDREQDQSDWKRCLYNALNRKDYLRVEELIIEGLSEDYDFPSLSDQTFDELLAKHRK